MKKILLSAGLLGLSLFSQAQDCEPVGTLNQNFSTFTEQSFPQKCWTSSHPYPNVYINNTAAAGEKNVTIYSGESANTPFYLVTPELTTLDGIHSLSFDGIAPPGAPGTVTVQIGTLTSPTDFTTFTNVGEAITLTATSTNYPNIVIPASDAQTHIAFKVIATGNHVVAKLDNIVWKGIAATCTALETLNEDFSNFTDDDLTLNCWSKSPGTPMLFISQEENGDNKYANFYTLFSPNVDAYLVTPELSTIDGNHQLTFDASLDAGSAVGAAVTLQVGTLTIANDYTTFVATGEVIQLPAESTPYTIQVEASETAKYIAFRFNGNGEHVAAIVDNVVWDEISTVCTAQEALNENFEAIEGDDLAEACWTVSSAGPFVNIDGDTDKYVSFYSFSFADTAAYLISPELTTIDGDHKLSFDTVKQLASAPGVTTVQVGTVSSLTDMTTFIPVGTAYTVAAENTTHNNIIIPANENHKYIAFKIIADGQHVAIELDNVVWTEVTAGLNDLNKTSFSIYPNPSADRNVTISHNLDKGSVNIYSLTGAVVYTGELDNTGVQSLNLSSLSAGMYVVKINSGNYSESKKLIIQ